MSIYINCVFIFQYLDLANDLQQTSIRSDAVFEMPEHKTCTVCRPLFGKGEKSGSRMTHNEGGGDFRYKCFKQWLATHMARIGAVFEELDTGSM
jgi:hypothetical protein